MVVLIGICGRTGSGKSEFAKRIQKTFTNEGKRVGIISMDDFYRALNEEDHQLALENKYDFDCLSSFDLSMLIATVASAKCGEKVSYNLYDHANHRHKANIKVVDPCDIWIVEGLYLFAVEQLLSMFDLKIFMEVDADESLIRRIRRDSVTRRRTIEGVLAQYEQYVKPAYDRIVAQSRQYADICVMRGAYNAPALDSVISYCRSL